MALLGMGCGVDRTGEQDPIASKGLLNLPFDAGRKPLLVPTAAELIVVQSGESAIPMTGDVAHYSASSDTWELLPTPPTLLGAAAAVTSQEVVLTGLPCDDEIGCQSTTPLMLRLNLDGGGWQAEEFGTPVSSDQWSAERLAQSSDSAWFVINDRIVRVSTKGLDQSPPAPASGSPCLVGDEVVTALFDPDSPDPDEEGVAQRHVWRLSASDVLAESNWEIVPASTTAGVVSDKVEFVTACTANGLVAISQSWDLTIWDTELQRWHRTSLTDVPSVSPLNPTVVDLPDGHLMVDLGEDGVFKIADGRVQAISAAPVTGAPRYWTVFQEKLLVYSASGSPAGSLDVVSATAE